MQVSMGFPQKVKSMDEGVTTKEIKFLELSVKEALEQVLKQVDIPYTIIVPTGDKDVAKLFEQNKITLKLFKGIPYDEVIRQIFVCGGLGVKRGGE